ncbi:class I lanthipeptide [Aquimarina aggregata]|uniref:class I lanthipeptide n=1 Tax=Aquimarina aggregata TaxID=1642818 RepID=UPI000A6F4F50|nr:class I lanthipeptide [Aquimarina aggregata]
MKKSRETKKLSLNKITISNLNRNSLRKIVGGTNEESEADPQDPLCPLSKVC